MNNIPQGYDMEADAQREITALLKRNKTCDEITAHEINDQMDRDREVKRAIAANAIICCCITIALCLSMIVIMP